MPRSLLPRRLAAFVAALCLAVAWGSIVQTQFNLAALESLGASIPWRLRLLTTAQDLIGFGPFYAALVFVAYLIAFPVAALLTRASPRLRPAWFALAGFASLIVAVRGVDALVPPPVLIAATRETSGLLAMAIGGAVAGLAFAWLTRRSSPPSVTD